MPFAMGWLNQHFRMNNYVVTPEEAAHYGQELFKLVQSGDVKINIHEVYPFTAEGVQQAQRDLTTGKTIGKLLIKVNPEA